MNRTEFVRVVLGANATQLSELLRSTATELNIEITEDTIFRLQVLYGPSIDFFDKVQGEITFVVAQLAQVVDAAKMSMTHRAELTQLLECYWNICRAKADFPGINEVLDGLLAVKSAARELSEADVVAVATALQRHENFTTNCVSLCVAYYKYSEEKWYRDLMTDAIRYLVSRHGLTSNERVAAICLAAHWEFPERKVDVTLARLYLQNPIVATPLKIGMLFMLDPECLHDICGTSEAENSNYANALLNEVPPSVKLVLFELCMKEQVV